MGLKIVSERAMQICETVRGGGLPWVRSERKAKSIDNGWVPVNEPLKDWLLHITT